jgi:hypothetical protein
MTLATETLLDDVKTVTADGRDLVCEATEKSAARVVGALDKVRAPPKRMQDRP